jgi:hypothetical protein
VIGAAKSGTTSLHYYLQQHPDIFMSTEEKEINFYAFEGQRVVFNGPGEHGLCTTVTDLGTYQEYFRFVNHERAVGEAAPIYLYSDRAAANIHRYAPQSKLIAIFRHPVDRAFSSYLHMVRDGREKLGSFEDGLLAEEQRVAQGWDFGWFYKRVGFYAEQVERYLDLFPREQMRFYLYDDFVADPASLLVDLYGFLGVDPDFRTSTLVRYNATGVPKNKVLGRMLQNPKLLRSVTKPFLPKSTRRALFQLVRQKLYYKPSLSKATRLDLLEVYRDDILRLQHLIGRDLSRWLRA